MKKQEDGERKSRWDPPTVSLYLSISLTLSLGVNVCLRTLKNWQREKKQGQLSGHIEVKRQ